MNQELLVEGPWGNADEPRERMGPWRSAEENAEFNGQATYIRLGIASANALAAAIVTLLVAWWWRPCSCGSSSSCCS